MGSRPHYHRGSSLVQLGLSVIMFIITYGILFTLLPQILGVFYSTLNETPISDSGWATMSTETQTVIQFLVPLAASIGIFLLVIKVLMVATTRGRD